VASGDVELRVASKGTSVLPADLAKILLNLRCPGATREEAKAKLKGTVDTLTKALVELGVPRSDITIDDALPQMGFVGNEALDSELFSAAAQQQASKQPHFAMGVIKVTLTNLGLLPRVREMLNDKNAVILESPSLALRDDRAARRLAITDAVRRAQADADAYAASLGLRVGRIVRVTDQASQPGMIPNYDEMIRKLVPSHDLKPGMVETSVVAAVDFILTPR